MTCSREHSFDIARSGYINLLQPQDRRSRHPGDSADAVQARRRLHDSGITEPLAKEIGAIAAYTSPGPILDAGCGDGFYLSSLSRERNTEAHGIDVSLPAIEAAARRYPQSEWLVANADRGIPYASASFALILSITGRMNPDEFQRVLAPDGHVLVGLAAPDDLIELRGVGRDRIPNVRKAFESKFKLLDHRRVSTNADLTSDSVSDVLLSIYRPMQRHVSSPMRVTFSLDLLLFQRSDA